MTLSKDLKARVADIYSQGDVTMREVAETFGVSLGFSHNVIAHHRRFGLVWTDYVPCQPMIYLGPRGRRRVLDAIDMLCIREIIGVEPSIYLDELQHKLAIGRNVYNGGHPGKPIRNARHLEVHWVVGEPAKPPAKRRLAKRDAGGRYAITPDTLPYRVSR